MSAITCLESIPGHTECVVTGASKNNYIIVKRDAVLKYNFDKDEWIKILDKPKNFDFWRCSATLNDNGELFLLDSEDGKLAKLQLNNSSFEILYDNVVKVGWGATSIMINNILNVVGGYNNNSHFQWNTEKKKFIKIGQISNEKFIKCLGYFGLVHNKVSNCLLLLGGTDNIYKFNQIFEFNMAKKKWSTLKVRLPKSLSRFGSVFVMNNKYVLVFGGCMNGYYYSDIIYIYDIEHRTIKKSKYKCPKKGCYSAITINNDPSDQKTIYGYVRKQWILLNINMHYFPPVYILNIIEKYFRNEYVYLLNMGMDGNHYKIN
eukprot:157353_1